MRQPVRLFPDFSKLSLWFIVLLTLGGFFTRGVEAPFSESEKEIKEGAAPLPIGLIEADISIVPDLPLASSVSLFQPAEKDKSPKAKKVNNTEYLNQLINSVIEFNSYYNFKGQRISHKKATDMLKAALPLAIKASNAFLALQSLEGTGRRLSISFITAKDQKNAGYDERIKGFYLPSLPAPGEIFLSITRLESDVKQFGISERNYLETLLANELSAYKAATVQAIVHFPSSSEELADLDLIPWVSNEEKKQLEKAILVGLQAFFNLPTLEGWVQNKTYRLCLSKILSYRIKVIDNFIETINGKLTENNQDIFDIILKDSKLMDSSFYTRNNKNIQLAECDSDIASLVASIPQKEAEKTFSAWLTYHEKWAHKYLSTSKSSSYISMHSP